ncbi:hypothetical protein F4780DRAFT_202026 [Xylariomycetidae sp. FL0641]|nr:hypothetical protein F4780DRAFT_202026 [Xylariomycetidae sp. FL0641]
MESFFSSRGGYQMPVKRQLSQLYNDTKKSSDFVREPPQAADDPEIKALHRKLRIQKDRLVSWGLEWSDPNQTEIDESISKAGLSDLVGSIMGTIKDILAEAEPLWLASKRATGSEKTPELGSGDKKIPLVVWDKGRFEDLVNDLTASIDTLCDLSRTRLSTSSGTSKLTKSAVSMEDLRPYGSTRIQTPQQIDPNTLTSLRSQQPTSISQTETTRDRPQEIFFMNKQAYAELTRRPERQSWSPLLVEYAPIDPIYSATGIMPDMSRFEKLSTGLQTESQRSPGSWIGLPLLLGYYEDMDNSRLALIYQFPPAFNPVTFEDLTQNPLDNLYTLKDLLSRPDFEPTLEAKFRLAYNLVNTVFDMHARGITHGNIQGSSISFCNTVGNDPAMHLGEVDIRKPLLSSFEVFSEDATPGQPPVASMLHRHPLDPKVTAQSPLASNAETKTLDLYSLAMILVSIGLWSTLENLAPSQENPTIPESVLHQLAIRCGTPYMKAVQACWNAVERELASPGTGEEIINQVQMRASRYLEACCILDNLSGLDDRLGDEPGTRQTASSGDSKLREATSSSAGPSTTLGTPSSRLGRMPPPVGPEPQLTQLEQSSSSPRERPSSPGEKSPKMRLYPQIPLPADILTQWNETLMPQINQALRSFYRKNPESVEISLESIGESPQQTTPTILVVCTSVSKVRAILKKKFNGLFDESAGLALKVCRGSVLRSRKGAVRSMAKGDVAGDAGDVSEEEKDENLAANPDYQEKPRNGASIGAWIGDKHLPPVSLGGLVVVDDKPYGMTVHHMLDDPDSPEVPTDPSQQEQGQLFRSSAAAQEMKYLREGDTSADSSSSSSGGDDFACEFSDSGSEFSETDITSDDDEGGDDEEFTEPGDIPGVEPECGDGYLITQPALDDVQEGFYPCEDTKDEEHLETYGLGHVYASSGLRRREAKGLTHEIDWALFEFHDNRLPNDNTIPTATTATTTTTSTFRDASSAATLQPTEVAPMKSLPGLEVQCMARTSGLQTGQILPALTSVKIYGRTSPSDTYQVRGHRHPHLRNAKCLGVPGDSGAWVVDRGSGRVAGHVLAYSTRKRVAYICPMEVLLEDIAETLAAHEVRLPGLAGLGRRRNEAGQEEEVEDELIEVSDLESWDGDGDVALDYEKEADEGVPWMRGR